MLQICCAFPLHYGGAATWAMREQPRPSCHGSESPVARSVRSDIVQATGAQFAPRTSKDQGLMRRTCRTRSKTSGASCANQCAQRAALEKACPTTCGSAWRPLITCTIWIEMAVGHAHEQMIAKWRECFLVSRRGCDIVTSRFGLQTYVAFDDGCIHVLHVQCQVLYMCIVAASREARLCCFLAV